MISIDINKLHKKHLFELKIDDKIEIEKNIRNKFKTIVSKIKNIDVGNDIFNSKKDGVCKKLVDIFNDVATIKISENDDYELKKLDGEIKKLTMEINKKKQEYDKLKNKNSYVEKIINCNSNLLLIYLTDKHKSSNKYKLYL
jgi:hypothetical protein